MSAHGKASRLLATAVCAALLSGCVAERLHHEGLAAIDAGNYEDGIEKLSAAVRREPRNLSYRLDLRAREEGAIQRLIADADTLRGAGRREQAAGVYRRVLAIEPANDRALRGLEGVLGDQRHSTAVTQAQAAALANELDRAEAALRAVLAEDPGFAPAIALQQQLDLQRGPVQATPKLKTRDSRPVSLQFRDASTRMVFEVLSRQTGINFVFDKDIKADGKTTIFVQDVPIEAAIDLVLGQNQLARQVLSPNMVMLYPNTPAKQRDYQDQIIKTFYLSDADPKQAQSLVKTMLNPRAMFVDERTGVLVIRDTPELVRMAEKLLSSLDLPDAEVMLEVEVLELTRTKLDQLGIKYPSSATVSPTSLLAATSSSSTPSALSLNDLRHQNGNTLTVTPLSVTLDLLKQSSTTNTLASPRIRARNHEKAKVLIGQRVPNISTTTAGINAVSPVFTSAVQYLDVGLTLDVEPTIHRDGDVAIKLALEVSSIIAQVPTPGGGTAYQIGTRNATTLLQLKDGETQILAGLIQDTDQRSQSNLPGIGDIPLLGRLFGDHKVDRQKTEIVLAVTPRVIRAQRRPSSETTEFWYGTESSTRSAPLGGITLSGAAVTAPAAATPGPRPLAEASGVLSSAVAVVAPTASAGGQAVLAAPPLLSWLGPSEVGVGEEFEVTLRLDSERPLTQLRSQVRFDAAVLELIAASGGDLAGSANTRVETPRGSALLEAVGPGDAAAEGSLALLVLHFKALAPRTATALAVRLAASDSAGGAVQPAAPAFSLAVHP